MKYIVYFTTNNKSKVNGQNRIYIGVHETKNPEVFDGYLGDSVYVNQSSTFKYPKTPFQCAVKKYGTEAFKRQTLFVCDTKEAAYKKLAELVTEDFVKQDHVYNLNVESEYSASPIYQFNIEGEFVRKWDCLSDAYSFYGYPREKFESAILYRYVLVNSFWATTPTINVLGYSIKNGSYRLIHLYSSKGKLIKEFMSINDCAEYFSLSYKDIADAIKNQNMILNKYYVSDKLTDLFIPKPRRQYRKAEFHVYKEGKYIGKYVGKEIMNIIKLHSWAKIKNVMSLRNGWYEDFYISNTKIDESEIPAKQFGTRVDVYTMYGEFIETVGSLKELKVKYSVPSSVVKNIQLGDKYFQEYIFKYHSNKSSK